MLATRMQAVAISVAQTAVRSTVAHTVRRHSSLVTRSLHMTRFATATHATPALFHSATQSEHISDHRGASKLWAAGAVILASSAFLLRDQAHAEAATVPSTGRSGRSVYSAGDGIYGCLGTGDSAQATPTLIPALSHVGPIVQIVAAGNHAAAVTEDGRVYTWGSAGAGVLAHEVSGSSPAVSGVTAQPQQVTALAGHRIVQLSLSETHAAAVELLPSGSTTVWTWGTVGPSLGLPTSEPALDPAIQLKQKGRGSLDVRTVDAEPDNAAGSPWRARLPTLVPGLQPGSPALPAGQHVVSVACGPAHTLALVSDGSVLSFGSDREGALGSGERAARSEPLPLAVGSLPPKEQDPVVALAAGQGFSLFLLASGQVYFTGANDRGQAGTGSTQRRYLSPVAISSLPSNICSVSAGAYHALAMSRGGSQAFAWGLNQQGQAGVGNRDIEIRSPRSIKFPPTTLTESHLVALEGGFAHSGSIDAQGRLLLWGRGREGQLMRGDQLESIAATRDTPVEASFFSKRKLHVLQCAAGNDFTLALVAEPPLQADQHQQTRR